MKLKVSKEGILEVTRAPEGILEAGASLRSEPVLLGVSVGLCPFAVLTLKRLDCSVPPFRIDPLVSL